MIRIEHLRKSFGSLEVLKDINTEIHQGEVVAIIGPSGTGKSTLLRCLNLLDPPTGGNIYVNDIPLLDKKTNVAKIRQKMGMVFQSFNLYAHLCVLDNLTIGPIKLLKKDKAAARDKALELLKLVGLSEKADNYPDQLSGGQKQRVAIARCLAMEPDIILFDEPTSALDPTMVSEVLSVIRRLARDGMTMAIVTHEMEFARNIASRIFYMDEGLIYEEGPPDQIFDHPQREKTRAFINRVRSFNYHIASRDYDLYAMNALIETFCTKHLLGQKTTDSIQLLVEEMLGLLPEITDLDLRVAYSEKTGSIELAVSSAGAASDMLAAASQQPDDLALRLIHSRCESIQYHYENGRNHWLIAVRHP